jgi:hypothetical protein
MILAHSYRGVNPSWQDGAELSTHGNQEAEQNKEVVTFKSTPTVTLSFN